MKKLLLNPGPTNTTFKTKVAQWLGSDVCHRTEEFSSLLKNVKIRLLERFGDVGFNASLLGGSGPLGLEAMITSLFPRETIHIINAGIYGARAIKICQTYNLNYIEVSANNIDSLAADTSVKNLFFVENETTTGEKFCPYIMRNLFPNARLFIDATSAFGSSCYEGLYNNIAAICFCGNKCLQSTPGVSVVIYSNKSQLYERSFYSSLSHYEGDNIPFTLPTQSIYALNSALDQNINNAKTLNKRRDRLISALKKLQIYCINKYPCNSILGFQHPTLNYQKLAELLESHNIIIYSPVPDIKNSFRLSTMSSDFDKKFKFLIRKLHDSCLH